MFALNLWDIRLYFRCIVDLSFHTVIDSACYSELDISTASLPPYSIDNPDTSPSQFTRSFSRSSMKRHSQRGAISQNNTEIPEVSML